MTFDPLLIIDRHDTIGMVHRTGDEVFHDFTFAKKGKSMSDLTSRFEAAAKQAKSLPEKPDNETLLRLYALYKQATVGDVASKRPGFTDFVGRAKYDAWSKTQGTSQEEAMQQYVDLVGSLVTA